VRIDGGLRRVPSNAIAKTVGGNRIPIDTREELGSGGASIIIRDKGANLSYRNENVLLSGERYPETDNSYLVHVQAGFLQ
jgi:hypothetical protein